MFRAISSTLSYLFFGKPACLSINSSDASAASLYTEFETPSFSHVRSGRKTKKAIEKMRSTRKKKSAPVELAKKKRKVVVDLDEYSLEKKKKKNNGKTGVASEEGDYHRKRSGEVDSGVDKDKLSRFLQNLKSYQELMKKVSSPADVNARAI